MNRRLDREGIGMTSRRTRDRLVSRLRDSGISDQRVLDAMASTPRHLFVEEALSHRAYEDTALPIGHGQTISQPLVVAMMTEAVMQATGPGAAPARVLEIGTGCGYQTAVLAPLVERVYSIERIGPLHHRARQLLRDLGLRNVRLRHGDGMLGWQGEEGFDAIIVAAAPEQVPQALLSQLADGGRMVIPVGGRGMQQLTLVERDGDSFNQRVLEAVHFVPLLGGTRG